MPVGLPAKTTYVDGDVFSASDINDTNGTLNLVGQTQNFYAGKNKIINGDFNINQRNFTTSTAGSAYLFDRFYSEASGGTFTYSAQTFTSGTAPVSGYESTNFVRLAVSGQSTGNYAGVNQKIEDVRTFAGQTVTLSFWAKAISGTPKVGIYVLQEFGSGGSASVGDYKPSPTISTSWARYSATFTMPSISGKTIGVGSCVRIALSASDDFNPTQGAQATTIDFWGFQLEAGSTATAFQIATGTIQGELAACQRYYQKSFPQGTAPAQNAGKTGVVYFSQVAAGAVNQTVGGIRFPVVMRATPTITFFNPDAANAQIRNVNAAGDWSSTVAEQIGDAGFGLQATGRSGSGAGDRAAVHYTASSEL